MAEFPFRIVPNPPTDEDHHDESAKTTPQDELAELRRLLLEPEQLQINNILHRLNTSRVRATESSRVLTEAIRLRNTEDDSLQDALAPTVVRAFHTSVKQDPRPVAEAISPLMGPAIRRAIAAALNGLAQSFDRALQHSFSPQGMKWRWEAWKTRKPFAEVVIRHTLLYRVEQVFLIHRQSGLLLHHVTASSIDAQDADIVSGMMTAMQEALRNFGRDSFGPTQRDGIDTLSLGEREIWFETGSNAVLAVVIRGDAPESLRSDFFAPAIEAIQLEQHDALEMFNGDNTPFETSRPHLESCLQWQDRGQTPTAEFKVPRYIWILLALIPLVLAMWGLFSWRENRRWNAYLDLLKSRPGIVVTETGWKNGKRYIAGLRDPLAQNPQDILAQEAAISPDTVEPHWQFYQAYDPSFVLTRAQQLLAPPPGIALRFDEYNHVLIANGFASSQWIADARRFARMLPGVTSLDERELLDEQPKLHIEQTILRFVAGKPQLAPRQDQSLQTVLSSALELSKLATASSHKLRFEIIGHTDAEGTEEANLKLSQERASYVLSLLTAKGIPAEMLVATGVGTHQPVRIPADNPFNRSVSFKLSLLGKERQ